MNKIKLAIDVTKLDKTQIKERTYKNKDGQEVTAKDLNLELVALKEKKFIKQGDNWVMFKTHFIAHPSTKRDDGTYENGAIVGDGITFEYSQQKAQGYGNAVDNMSSQEDISSQVPF
jgi:hypothetical protein